MDLEDVMLIYKALLAHGFSNFTLEILEYCAGSADWKKNMSLPSPPLRVWSTNKLNTFFRIHFNQSLRVLILVILSYTQELMVY
jgi:hypothetical protein